MGKAGVVGDKISICKNGDSVAFLTVVDLVIENLEQHWRKNAGDAELEFTMVASMERVHTVLSSLEDMSSISALEEDGILVHD
ncbi:MAG: hypothetical protein OXC63_05385 [Aestuariivita sp.]|nr:hypothetical protein [Aestuariivita sp.]MCY4347598.1 hypothetical protein [Aestuariivita sp.]